MILGLPPASWLLIAVSIGCGLALEILYLRARSRDESPPGPRAGAIPSDPPTGEPPPAPAGSPPGARGS